MWQPPMQTMGDWDGNYFEAALWQVSRRRKNCSKGHSPGGTCPTTPPYRRQRSTNTQVGPNSIFLHKHTIPFFMMKNEGAFSEELEVEIQTINAQPFRWSITRLEAKHPIHREALGCPFGNFRGARTGYKGYPKATFMIKKAINIYNLV